MLKHAAATVLLTPALFTLMSKFQDGLCEEMRLLQSLPTPPRLAPRRPADNDADLIDGVMTPWVHDHGVARLHLLTDVRLKECVVVWAMTKSRLSELDWTVYLPTLVQRPELFQKATIAAAATDLRLARWLHDQMVKRQVALWVDHDALGNVIGAGALDGLQWLLQVWNVGMPDRAQLDRFCLHRAMESRQKNVAEWMATRVPKPTLLSAYLLSDRDGDMLYDVAHAGGLDSVEFDSGRISGWSLEKSMRVLDKCLVLEHSGNVRLDRMKKYLWYATSHAKMRSLQWLVRVINPVDVHEVVYATRPFIDRKNALQIGLRRGGVPFLELFESVGVHLSPDEMDSEFNDAIRMSIDCSFGALPLWLSDDRHTYDVDSKTTAMLTWLVERRGGRAVVLRHLILKRSSSLTCFFANLVFEWISLPDTQLDGFKRLFHSWKTTATHAQRARLYDGCLRHATMHGKKAMAAWFASQMSKAAVLTCYFRDDKHGNVLHDVVDPDAKIDMDVLAPFLAHWSTVKARNVLKALPSLRTDGWLLRWLARRNARILPFQTIYNAWLTLVDTDDAEKHRIQIQCLAVGHARSVHYMLTCDPTLLVMFAKAASLAHIGRLHAMAARTVTIGELHEVETQVLVDAVVAGRRGIVRLLTRKMQDLNYDGIAYARAVALSRGDTVMSDILLRVVM
ncbi:Aste57867_886 [Aphanomyces stellatus]|uniref:Aste57867_886 protein n=1 Tax=Aphanomyces stellatus TaxID=120398 RepID=A0A485K417_9STRA|nr:hypothetical protein As57867_000885 [Aphanomyces stellatus]VFT78110.1 Aste57867_886 [Aphanomyces stellatus]